MARPALECCVVGVLASVVGVLVGVLASVVVRTIPYVSISTGLSLTFNDAAKRHVLSVEDAQKGQIEEGRRVLVSIKVSLTLGAQMQGRGGVVRFVGPGWRVGGGAARNRALRLVEVKRGGFMARPCRDRRCRRRRPRSRRSRNRLGCSRRGRRDRFCRTHSRKARPGP